MNVTRPDCGHSIFKNDCVNCETLKQKWYAKLKGKNPKKPKFRDIEYGLEHPERLHEPLPVHHTDDLSEINSDDLPAIQTDYYDRALEIYHLWISDGRSKRDCFIALLFGSQDGKSGTERGIASALKAKRLRPNSRGAVRRTIAEIKNLILKKAQPHQIVEQSAVALYLLDSKPKKDEADGKTQQAPTNSSNTTRTAA